MLGFLFEVTKNFCDPYTLRWSLFYSVDDDRMVQIGLNWKATSKRTIRN